MFDLNVKRMLGNVAGTIEGTGGQMVDNAAAQGTVGLVNGTVNGVADMFTTGLDTLSSGLGLNPGFIAPLKGAFEGIKAGATTGGSIVTNNAQYGMLPSANQRMGYQGYYQMGANGGMVPMGNPQLGGGMGSLGAALGCFTADEAELYSLIQDPVQRQMFLIDKRMKQQSLLCSCLTNLMAAKQDVLKEMGRNLRS